jgi:hypothetical protein
MVNLTCQFDWAQVKPAAGKTYFWAHEWRCFQKRLAFDWVEYVDNDTLPNVCGHRLVHQGPKLSKQVEEGHFHSLASWVGTSIVSCPLEIAPLVLRALTLDWIQTSSSLVSSLLMAALELLSSHDHMSQYLIIIFLLYIYIYIYILLFLLLWRAPTESVL